MIALGLGSLSDSWTERKKHMKRGDEKVGPSICLPPLKARRWGFLYVQEQGSAMYVGPSYLVRVRGKKGDENTKM